MRLVRVLVSNERRGAVYTALDELGVDYVVTEGADRFGEASVVEIPVSDEAVGDVTDALSASGVDLDQYSVVGDLQWAATPNAERIRKQYAETYDRASDRELRSLVDQLNWDIWSFLAMMSLSAAIATVGLVLDSPVVVVGSAVIAPLVNPMLILGVGSVVGERWMVANSLRLQAGGLVVAVVTAFVLSIVAEGLALAPSTLSLATLDMVAARLAPSALVVLVGVVAGGAAAISLTAEASLINIVGVMVAAALVPAAAATGVALAWGNPSVALGSALLVVATVVAINLAILATLVAVGYRPSADLFAVAARRDIWRVAVAAVLLGAVVVGTGVATAGQVAFERTVTDAIDDVVAAPEYEDVSTVTVRSEYADYSPFTGPETVFVEVRRPAGRAYPDLPDRLADRIAEDTGRETTVEVEYVDRQASTTQREDQ